MIHTPRPQLRGFARQAGEAKLGEGLHVCIDIDNGMIRLRAPRYGRDHVVYLDEKTLDAFLEWLCTVRETLLADEGREQ